MRLFLVALFLVGLARSLWRAVICAKLASPHPPVVASSLKPPKEQGQAEDDGADGDSQPEEGVVAHPAMPLVQVTGLPVTTAIV